MNFKDYYDSAISYDEYEKRLGENLPLHQRHFKNFEIAKEFEDQMNSYPQCRILVITEPWCGDSLALLPVVKKLSDCNSVWQLKVVLRDENLQLIDQFLTNGGRAIPVFLFLDNESNFMFKWGPRPQVAQDIFEEYRTMIEKNDIEKSAVIRKIRTFYSKDRGVSAATELLTLLSQKLPR